MNADERKLIMRKICLSVIVTGSLLMSSTAAGAATATAASTTAMELDWAGSYSENLAVVGQWEGQWKYGYIDSKGKVVIKPQFNQAKNFSEGTAVVGMRMNGTMKYGYINKSGSYLLKPQFDAAESLHYGYAVVSNYANDKWTQGIVDAKGSIVAKPIYEMATLSDDLTARGYAVVQNGSQYAFVHLKSKSVSAFSYSSVTDVGSYIRISSIDSSGKELYGIILDNGKVIEPKFDWIHYFDSVNGVLGMVEINGKFGLIGKNGSYILEPKYEEIRAFDDGMTQVKVDGKYGLMNADGRMVTGIEFEELGAFVRGVSLVKKDGKWGILKIDGSYKVEPKYDQIFIMENEIQVIENGVKKVLDGSGDAKFDSDYEYMYPYTSIDGASKVKKNGKEVIIDKNGKPVFNVDYDQIWEFEDGAARITLNDKVGFLKRDGKYLVPPIYDSAYKETNETYYLTKDKDLWGIVFADGTTIKPMSEAPIQFNGDIGVIRVGGKSTYIDKKGKQLTKELFDSVSPFQDGMGMVYANGKTRYVTRSGEVLPVTYDYGSNFSDGYAFVYKDSTYHYIDKTGKYVFENNKYVQAKPFSNGLAAFMGSNYKWGYIDTKGKIVIANQFDYAYDFDEKLAPVRVGDKFGFIDRTGKLVLKAAYTGLSEFENGIANVWTNDKYGYVTSKGEYKTTPASNPNLVFVDGIAPVRMMSATESRYYWGYMKSDGSWLVKPQFDYAYPFNNGAGTVGGNGRTGEVSKSGSVVWK